ncbi:palmitoyltransferase AKR1 isoform X2 [Aristolochia californica]
MALPQYGIYSNVRVCIDCFNNPSRSANNDSQISSDSVETVTNNFSSLAVSEDVDVQSKGPAAPVPANVPECNCGMPLCICEAPTPTTDRSPLQLQKPTTSTAQLNARPKKSTNTQQTEGRAAKSVSSASNSKQSSFFNLSQATNGALVSGDYEVSGEGLREAIKNHDAAAVKKLLNEAVDANYCDKQGFSLLHLAALFNQTEIAFILMDHGARSDCKNAQGETPIDCAPTMLQYKMQKKLEAGT